MALFETNTQVEKTPGQRDVALAPETCPKCGKMAEYVKHYANGDFMSSHGTVPREFTVRETGRKVMLKAASICHGSIKK